MQHLWRIGIILSVVLLALLPISEAEPADSTTRTSDEQALFVKGQLLYDRWCSLNFQLLQSEANALLQKVDDATKYYGITHPETSRRDAERQRRLDPLRQDVQAAKRDLDLYEIDIKAKYGGSLPAWWQ